jgi:hypothetical protein
MRERLTSVCGINPESSAPLLVGPKPLNELSTGRRDSRDTGKLFDRIRLQSARQGEHTWAGPWVTSTVRAEKLRDVRTTIKQRHY